MRDPSPAAGAWPSPLVRAAGESIEERCDIRDTHKSTFGREQLPTWCAQSLCRWVAFAKHSKGSSMEGNRCTAEWLRTGAACERANRDLGNKVVDAVFQNNHCGRAHQGGVVRGIMRVNRPGAWEFTYECPPALTCKTLQQLPREHGLMRKPLLEPHIHHYKRFRFNTGWSHTPVRCAAGATASRSRAFEFTSQRRQGNARRPPGRSLG